LLLQHSLRSCSCSTGCGLRAAARADNAYDLVLSSGFLAFASHSGFLKAVEAAGLHVSGVMGTSAGALSGSLYCAGYSPDSVRACAVGPAAGRVKARAAVAP